MPFVEESNKHVAVDISATDFSLPGTMKWLYVGVGGTVILSDYDDTNASYLNVASGDILPGRFKKVIKTGTTATNMIAVSYEARLAKDP